MLLLLLPWRGNPAHALLHLRRTDISFPFLHCPFHFIYCRIAFVFVRIDGVLLLRPLLSILVSFHFLFYLLASFLPFVRLSRDNRTQWNETTILAKCTITLSFISSSPSFISFFSSCPFCSSDPRIDNLRLDSTVFRSVSVLSFVVNRLVHCTRFCLPACLPRQIESNEMKINFSVAKCKSASAHQPTSRLASY